MTLKKMLAGSVVLCAGLTFVATGEADAARQCASGVKIIKPVVLEDPGRWTYTFDLSWCADGGTIVWAEPSVAARVHSPACRWVGRIEESLGKTPDGPVWKAFDMSEFSCQDGKGKENGVNPWVVVTFDPSGGYDSQSAIAAA
ncbi:hypothetical protein [Amycolatopsis sp. BJA-103]|uniref:hypothetical protein n=1 Tax=unclassified Amycolatopsis TaxID=2618356 RepID=UPI000C75DAAA|nr:hypothetical protein [Amycolatopsis sp. BJA-103]AUI61805.1 hypothetical protein BKN51_29020 [Amycolatopsis sp. BJA-103]PNE20895.1 hypothetical protein B1H26_03415 [Amycolatopsis sp. BJA-103]